DGIRDLTVTGVQTCALPISAEMRGAWAGEIGQTQFMPSSWIKYAVDFDGNGRRDLIRSAPDVLASTANYLKGYGWQKGKDWEPRSEERRVGKECRSGG